MQFEGKAIRKFVESPSLGAVTYQAQRLVEQLGTIRDSQYPLQACQIRDVFLVLADRIVHELWQLYNPNDPFGFASTTDIWRLRKLGNAIQFLNSCLRYLQASSPHDTPPAIQVALSQLTEVYFPRKNGTPVCLIRPQWKYNFKYAPITVHLRDIVGVDFFDPRNEFGAGSADELITALWTAKYGTDQQLPRQFGVLSFPKLDTDDTLLYPLLAHELAHFIDLSYSPLPKHMLDPLRATQRIRVEDIERILSREGAPIPSPSELANLRARASQLVSTCLRELLADLLATRMMGFAFFAAESEFLKTLIGWEGGFIQKDGYPSIRFRLHLILRQLTVPSSSSNFRAFLEQSQSVYPTLTVRLLEYLDVSSSHLALTSVTKSSLLPPFLFASSTHSVDLRIAEETVIGAVDDLFHVAMEIIPDSICARLTPQFFTRIEQLKDGRPPTCIQETQFSFAEILSASWAYQLLFGEEKEISHTELNDQHHEYQQTCKNILKAIEQISA